MVSLDAKDDCKILVEITRMMVMMMMEIKTSIKVKPWPKCCLLLFNVALANKDRLLGLFVYHSNGKSK